jgi:hypothetical protein
MAKRRRDSEALERQRRAREAERERAERRRRMLSVLAAGVVALVATAVVAIAVTAGGEEEGGGGHGGSGPALAHVHGLGVNPKDGTLHIATHTGLFRAPEGEPTATRVGGSQQDVMGFSVVRPDRFLGSGHPGPARTRRPTWV